MVFTPEHDAFILKANNRSGTRNDDGNWNYSLQSCIEQFTEAFPDFDVDYDALKYRRHVIIHRFEERHCICKKKSTGSTTKLTEDVLDDMRERMERSPQKYVPKLANQTGLFLRTCLKVLTEKLHMHPYKLTIPCHIKRIDTTPTR